MCTDTSSFPGSLQVLVVDDDTTCLLVVAALLKSWNYKAKHSNNALSILRNKKGLFDLVITDIHMPNMNGFELQKQVKEEFNLPVIMMSADDRENVVSKGLSVGAPFFIVKPMNTPELQKIQEFAMKIKNENNLKFSKSSKSQEVLTIVKNVSFRDDMHFLMSPENGNNVSKKSDLKNKRVKTMSKKTKVVWTKPLHNRFLEAVRIIGLEKAMPKQILEVMNISGLTRENIASHLQKYRLFLRRITNAKKPIINTAVINTIPLQTQTLIRQFKAPIQQSQSRVFNADFGIYSRVQEMPFSFPQNGTQEISLHGGHGFISKDHHHPRGSGGDDAVDFDCDGSLRGGGLEDLYFVGN